MFIEVPPAVPGPPFRPILLTLRTSSFSREPSWWLWGLRFAFPPRRMLSSISSRAYRPSEILSSETPVAHSLMGLFVLLLLGHESSLHILDTSSLSSVGLAERPETLPERPWPAVWPAPPPRPRDLVLSLTPAANPGVSHMKQKALQMALMKREWCVRLSEGRMSSDISRACTRGLGECGGQLPRWSSGDGLARHSSPPSTPQPVLSPRPGMDGRDRRIPASASDASGGNEGIRASAFPTAAGKTLRVRSPPSK